MAEAVAEAEAGARAVAEAGAVGFLEAVPMGSRTMQNH